MKQQTTWTVPATVLRVIDGDTLEVACDLGFRITYRAKVRLQGINCPELPTEAGLTARGFTIHYLGFRAGVLPPQVTVTSHSLDKYGRVLGEVTTADGPLSVALVNAGHAVAAK